MKDRILEKNRQELLPVDFSRVFYLSFATPLSFLLSVYYPAFFFLLLRSFTHRDIDHALYLDIPTTYERDRWQAHPHFIPVAARDGCGLARSIATVRANVKRNASASSGDFSPRS